MSSSPACRPGAANHERLAQNIPKRSSLHTELFQDESRLQDPTKLGRPVWSVWLFHDVRPREKGVQRGRESETRLWRERACHNAAARRQRPSQALRARPLRATPAAAPTQRPPRRGANDLTRATTFRARSPSLSLSLSRARAPRVRPSLSSESTIWGQTLPLTHSQSVRAERVRRVHRGAAAPAPARTARTASEPLERLRFPARALEYHAQGY